MAVIGTLVARLNMDSRGFTRGSNKAQGSMGKLKKASKAVTIALTGVGIAAATTASVGFASLIRSSFTTIDSLAKVSDKLGLTTESLAGLRSSAELTGVSQQTMDTALQRMVRRLSEAKQGAGVAVKALDELGISIEYISQLTPDKQFNVISESMSKVESQSDKVRLAFALFDTEGVGLINTLNLGSDALEANQKRLEELGVAVSRIDAAKIEELNDAYFKLTESITGLANKTAIAFGPQTTKLIDSVANNIGSVNEVFRTAAFGAKGFLDVLSDINKAVMDFDFQAMKRLFKFAGTGISGGGGKQYEQVGNPNAPGPKPPTNAEIFQGLTNEKSKEQRDKMTKDVTQAMSQALKGFNLIKNPIASVIKKPFEDQEKLNSVTKGFTDAKNMIGTVDDFLYNTYKKGERYVKKELASSKDKEKTDFGYGDTSAKTKGSAEAFSAILRNKSNSDEKMIASNTKATVEALAGLYDKLTDLVQFTENQEGVPVVSLD